MLSTFKLKTEKSGPYFVALFVVAILGFWPSYFGKFFDGTADFNFYFHFHAATALLWVIALIVQPILIKRKQLALHRQIGKLSYLLMPVLFISVILLAHHRTDPQSASLGLDLWIPFKDLLIIGIMYSIAIRYRRQTAIHARAMIVAGMALIEPALVRLIMNTILPGGPGYLATLATIYSIFAVLMVAERDQKQGRWVFPLGVGVLLFVHSVIVFNIRIGAWDAFARWFVSLPLT